MEKELRVSSSLAQDEYTRPFKDADDTSAQRFDLMIHPKSRSWTQRHEYFTKALKSNRTIGQIITANFTYHEARLLKPSDRADIKRLHDANTIRYKALLAGRFAGIEDSLATKFTMAYFGLPVAPIPNILKDIAMMVGLEEEEVPLYSIKPPLHFLTAHSHRNWGKDSLRTNEDDNYPIPIPKVTEPILNLRGGGTYDDDGFREDYIPADETPAAESEEWVYLYGVNGRIPFVPRKWRSFASVLYQLLRIDKYSAREDQSSLEEMFTLFVFDHKVGKSEMIHDQLPLRKTSPAMVHLLGHFTGKGEHDHRNCCGLFAELGWTKVNLGPDTLEPVKEQFETDVLKIGRTLGHISNGPEEEAISHAYIALPKTKSATFVIGKYASDQYNAHLTAAIEILFGIQENADYNHALFRIFDKKKPKPHYEIPVIYGGMGLPQWVWELLHPLNSPDACWMVECMWLDEEVDPIILPNYYPRPHPHLVSAHNELAVPFNQAHSSIIEAITEALDADTVRKVDSVFGIDGDMALGLYGPNKGWNIDLASKPGYAERFGKQLERKPIWFLSLVVNWVNGHCRLLPGWCKGGEVSVEMPPLTSDLLTFREAIDELCQLTKHERDPHKDFIFLKETPSVDSLQVQDMDSPAYLITPDTTENDWLCIRRCITSPDIAVSFFEKSEVDWTTCIAKNNIWGPRVGNHDIEQPKRDILVLRDLDGCEIEPMAEYPSAPIPLRPVAAVDGNVNDRNDRVTPAPSSFRTSAFKTPWVPKAKAETTSGSYTLQLPKTAVLSGDPSQRTEEYDVGILATCRPELDIGYLKEVFRDQSVSPAVSEGEPDGQGEDDEMDDPGSEHDNNVGDDEAERENDRMDLDDHTFNEGREFQDVGEEEHIVDSLPGPSIRAPWARNTVGKDDRGHTWATQPSVFDGFNPNDRTSIAEISIPINAAPVEKVHRTSFNTDLFTKAFLTPTEQADLQRFGWDTRNMLLKRTVKCPTKNCNFTCRLDDEDAMDEHFQRVHQSRKCPWCEESLFEFWDQEQKRKHFRDKHSREMTAILGLPIQPSTTAVPPQPGNMLLGGPIRPQTQGAVPHQGHFSQRPSNPFGRDQGVPHPSGASHQRRTAGIGHPAQNDTWAPSRQAFGQPSTFGPSATGAGGNAFNSRMPNLKGNVSNPNQNNPTFVQGPAPYNPFASSPAAPAVPVNPYRANMDKILKEMRPLPKPLQPPRLLAYPLAWYDKPGPRAFSDPIKRCSYPKCISPNLQRFGSDGIWKHYNLHHPSHKMDACPFCGLSFTLRTGTDADGNPIIEHRDVDQCIKHFDCHIWKLWDILEPVEEQTWSLPKPKPGYPWTVPADEWDKIEARHAELKRTGNYGLPTLAMRKQAAAENTTATQSEAVQTTDTTTRPEGPQTAATTTQPDAPQSTTVPAVAPQTANEAAMVTQALKKCAYFEKCGAYVGAMTHQQYRRHIRASHGKETQIPSSGDEDYGNESGEERQSRQSTPSPEGPGRTDSPSRPSTKPASRTQEVTLDSSDFEIIDAPSNDSSSSLVVVDKPQITMKTTPKTAPKTAPKVTPNPLPANDEPDTESDAAGPSETASTVSRGRRSTKKVPDSGAEDQSDAASTVSQGRDSTKKIKIKLNPKTKPAVATSADDTQGSGSKSSATEGRIRTAKKAKAPQQDGESDSNYEDDGDESDDEEPEDGAVVVPRRRGRSPDWVKKLGPGDPDFDPDDDMYCSKCLRKAPKRRSRSPNQSSKIGRQQELEFHTDQERCCRIRNGEGSADHLPNRSGWIRAKKLPMKLGDLKDKFRRRYPTYALTLYPTKSNLGNATLWRADPNNEDNEAWWDIPWPPYEGYPPFPGKWEAPGEPWDNTPAGRKRREMYIGTQVYDPTYRYSSDSDSDDELRPDVDDLADLQSDISAGQKRRASAAASGNDTDAPAAKKVKKYKTVVKTPKTAKRAGKASTQASRTSSRIRGQKPSASPASSQALSQASVDQDKDKDEDKDDGKGKDDDEDKDNVRDNDGIKWY
ncbi:transaldolase [Fusarium heterosporum]|uniref:Transaldolase n=1 Tax=Fusarium heterosporum TaxID=42747 RepID=A0A8H5WRW1_FUSHE|nr:transaldolase [Fusarium heterosporum]